MPKHPPSDQSAVLLVDNGSLEPASTLALRELARRLAAAAGVEVRPVSLLHSSAVDPALLGGQRAEIVEPTLLRLAEEGNKRFIVVPLFLGPSAAITEYLPKRVGHLRQLFPELSVDIAPCLVDAAHPADDRIAKILAERIRKTAAEANFCHPAVAVVDHGTPQPAVNAVRELVTSQVRALLGDFARTVAACSMERRPEPEYDFNEPLLEKLLEAKDFSTGEVVVARMFLLPGRHAGPDGDIEQICLAAVQCHPARKIALTEPLASHPDLVSILTGRLKQVLPGGA